MIKHLDYLTFMRYVKRNGCKSHLRSRIETQWFNGEYAHGPALPLLLSELQEQDVIDGFLSSPGEDSFRALFRVVSPRVFRYLRLHGCERALAEDLTQEVMITVHTQSRTLRDRSLFLPWLFRVVRNIWLQHLRHESRQVRVTDFPKWTDTTSRDPDLIGSTDFSRWLASLPLADRDLILLRYVEGLEYHEIASLLSRPIGTVQWRIFELKRRLAAHFLKEKA